MTIEQQRFAMPLLQRVEPVANRVMIGPVDLLYSPGQLVLVDGPTPKRTVSMRPRRDQSQPVAGSGACRHCARAFDGGRIQLVFVPVAVDHRARHRLDHSPKTGANRSPGQPVNQRIFQRFQR